MGAMDAMDTDKYCGLVACPPTMGADMDTALLCCTAPQNELKVLTDDVAALRSQQTAVEQRNRDLGSK